MTGLYDNLQLALHGLWRRRWLAVAIAWGVAVAGWLALSLIPNRYESRARVMVQSSSLLNDRVGITPADRARAVEQVRQSLTAQATLEQVVRSTDLARHAQGDAAIAARASKLARDITIVAQQDNLFDLTVSQSDTSLTNRENATIAQQVVVRLIEAFATGNVAGGGAEAGQTLRFLDTQIAETGKKLAAAAAKRAAFDADYMAALPGSGTVDQRLDLARADIARLDGELAAAQSSLAALNGQLASTPATTYTPGVVIPGAGAAGGSAATAAIQGQIADAQMRGWTENHPDMQVLRKQLARARAAETPAAGPRMTAGTSVPNPMYSSIRAMQAEKAALAGSIAARKNQLQAQVNRVLALRMQNPELAAQATEVSRDYEVQKAQYDKLLADREDVRLRGVVATQSDATKVTVIDPPALPAAPAAPNRPLLATGVLLLALGAGVGAAIALNQLRGTFPTANKLASVSAIPVIGSIGTVVLPGERRTASTGRRRFIAATAGLVGLWIILLAAEFVSRSLVA